MITIDYSKKNPRSTPENKLYMHYMNGWNWRKTLQIVHHNHIICHLVMDLLCSDYNYADITYFKLTFWILVLANC